MRTGIVALLCLGGASAAQLRRASPPAAEASAAEASAASISHVLVLKKPDGVELELEAMIGVLTSVGVAREQASPILERLEADGEVIVAQGAREPLEQLGQAFGEIGVQALVQSIADLQAEAVAKVSEYTGSEVEELSLQGLKEWMQADEGVLVVFYGHECGHCKAMAPALQEAATQLRRSGVRVGAVNLQAMPGAEEVAEALELRGLPTVRFITNGNHLEYGGDRSAASLVAFATKAKGMAPEASAQEIADAAREAAAAAEAAAAEAAPGAEAVVAAQEAGKQEVPSAEGAATAAEGATAELAGSDVRPTGSKVEAASVSVAEKAALPQGGQGAEPAGGPAPAESKVHKSKLAQSKMAPVAAAA